MGLAQSHEGGLPTDGKLTKVAFHVDKELIEVDTASYAHFSLAEYLRDVHSKQSVKIGCAEGGCGACAVEVVTREQSGSVRVKTINSCMAPIISLHGAYIFTSKGLHDHDSTVHDAICKHNASQCGFCTPGMAVACHAAAAKAALHGTAPENKLDVRQAMDGNLCRCTGYRPLIDAADEVELKVADIEDLIPVGCGMRKEHTGRQQLITPQSVQTADGAQWYTPNTLKELMLAYDGTQRLVAGNTSVGLPGYSWPQGNVISLAYVEELHGVNWGEASISIGGNTTIQDCIDELQAAKSGRLADTWACGYDSILTHLNGIAGHHVRGAATVAGNITLACSGHFESDLATILLALGTSVRLAIKSSNKLVGRDFQDVSLEAFLNGEAPKDKAIVLNLTIPLLARNQRVFSKKLALRAANAHAQLNMTCSIKFAEEGEPAKDSVIDSAVVAAGFYRSDPATAGKANFMADSLPWRNTLLTNVNAALTGKAVGEGLEKALEGILLDLADAHSDWLPYYKSAAPSLLLRWLGPIAGVPHSDEHLEVAPFSSTQAVPDPDPALAPLGRPIPKYGIEMQASGDAVYAADLPRTKGCLYAALVLAPDVCDAFTLDSNEAAQVPGFVRLVTAADIPGTNNVQPGTDAPLFAASCIVFANQPVALALATSEHAALDAASKVLTHAAEVVHTPLATNPDVLVNGQRSTLPVTPDPQNIPAQETGTAQRAGSADGCASVAANAVSGGVPDGAVGALEDVREVKGDADAAIARAKADGVSTHVVEGVWESKPLSHMYMEPQTAVACADEDGIMHVHSATQVVDVVAAGVSTVLGVPLSKVVVECRRAGGGFGGKSTLAVMPAAAAALAAKVTNRQVRLSVNRRIDLACTGGRPRIKANYSAVHDNEGRVLAVKADFTFVTGYIPDYIPAQASAMLACTFSAYDVDSLDLKASFDQQKILPFTAMRAPGMVEDAHFTEHVLYHVAMASGKVPAQVRATNFKQLRQVPDPDGPPDASVEGILSDTLDWTTMKSMQFSVPKEQYTLPRIWEQLKQDADFDARQGEVAAFNAAHAWVSRGITMVPVCWAMVQKYAPALVHLRADGSVSISAPGAEIGQSLATKSMQAAAHELSKVASESSRIALAEHLLTVIRIVDNNTDALPNLGDTGGSTTSEACCRAISEACQTLVAGLKPFFDPNETDVVAAWQSVIGAASLSVCMTAVGGFANLPKKGFVDPRVMYNVYGAAIMEAELDSLTGERRIVRADVLYDCGLPLNSSADIGQAEGAFIMGLGQVLSEEMVIAETGGVLSNTTWHYKIPTALDIPATFNVSLLKGSKNRPVTSWAGSKAIGEPPLLLTTAVLEAVRLAVDAAYRKHARLAAVAATGHSSEQPISPDLAEQAAVQATVGLHPPATPWKLQAACGAVPLHKAYHAEL